MASKVSSNIRELEGTLIRVTAFANLNRTRSTWRFVQTVLQGLITSTKTTSSRRSTSSNHTGGLLQAEAVDDLIRIVPLTRVATGTSDRDVLCREDDTCRYPRSASCSATATTQR